MPRASGGNGGQGLGEKISERVGEFGAKREHCVASNGEAFAVGENHRMSAKFMVYCFFTLVGFVQVANIESEIWIFFGVLQNDF